MNVRVQFYAQLRDVAGASESSVQIPPNGTVTELLEEIYRKTPLLRSHDKTILVGAGVEFVDRNYTIKPGDTISIMPPVQGG
jgi:molybdopterin synthase sulfur carrier subunit